MKCHECGATLVADEIEGWFKHPPSKDCWLRHMTCLKEENVSTKRPKVEYISMGQSNWGLNFNYTWECNK